MTCVATLNQSGNNVHIVISFTLKLKPLGTRIRVSHLVLTTYKLAHRFR